MRLPSWFGKAVFEALLIVFGLVLALALNNWNEDRQTANRVAETRGFLLEEVRTNHARLTSDAILPHHRRLQRLLRAALDRSGPDRAALSQAVDAAFATGIHPFSPQDAVWRSVSAGPLMGEMNPRELFALTDAYRVQDELVTANRAIYGAILSWDMGANDAGTLRRRAYTLQGYLADVITMEEGLARDYATLLRRLENRQP